MNTEREEIELWIETRTCELRPDCGLAQYHIHVDDQLFWNLDEVTTAYGRELPFKQDKPKGRKWLPGGVADHKNHVHVSLTGLSPVVPGTIVTGLPNNLRPAQPGDVPSGIVVSTDPASGGGAVFTGPVGSPRSNHTPVGRAIDFNLPSDRAPGCICVISGPSVEGPDEDCPVHGRDAMVINSQVNRTATVTFDLNLPKPEDMDDDHLAGLSAIARYLSVPQSRLGPITNPGA